MLGYLYEKNKGENFEISNKLKNVSFDPDKYKISMLIDFLKI